MSFLVKKAEFATTKTLNSRFKVAVHKQVRDFIKTLNATVVKLVSFNYFTYLPVVGFMVIIKAVVCHIAILSQCHVNIMSMSIKLTTY